MRRGGIASGRRRGAGMIALVALVLLLAEQTALGATRDVVNGGFGSGDFTAWRTSTITDSTAFWSVYSGTRSPISGFAIPAPPGGRFAAVVDQNGPGSNLLYRNIRVDGDDAKLRMTIWYHNFVGAFFTPRSLLAGGDANQQLRIDILRPSANLRSLRRDDLLATIFRTKVGDPAQVAPMIVRVRVARWRGQTIRLRIAEVDNQGNFVAGVDSVGMLNHNGVPDPMVTTRIPATPPRLGYARKRG